MPAILVDQRQTERRELSQSASVSVVGTPAQTLQGEIRNLSEGGTQVRLREPLPPFTLVRIEYDDNLLLGEVVYCQQEQSGWLIGLRVEHVLFGLTALSHAMQAF
jgi:PilZ domain-containing protein